MSGATVGPHRKQVRHFETGDPRFLTFSCYRRLPLLSKDRTRRWFVEALPEARRTHGFHLWAWVVMPEHVHVLLWPPPVQATASSRTTIGTMRGILSSLKRPVATQAIRYLTEEAPAYLEKLTVRNRTRTYHRFWQPGSGYDENVMGVRALHDIIAYIHNNPVRRGLVARAEDWEWSSARDWMVVDPHRIAIDRTLPSLVEIPWSEIRGG